MLAEYLFGIKKAKLIKIILENKEREFYQAELALKLLLPIATVQYYLEQLVKHGILKRRETSYKTFYSVNKKFKGLEALKKISEL